ncbi:hydrogenase maturation nickel metallochaperone HypA [Wukongibacter sp. M2B1]|uniref:hydrogenase maturation nickel metallochaperone HypA n=1 Tax=Wukongibacter sp. M2B1 TaxID=3088895 RepID=UPI003D7BC71D
MHETAVISEVLKTVDENIKAYGLKRVDKIILGVGEFTCIEESTLRFAFDAMAKGTVCENSRLILDKIEATAYCDNCKETFGISYTKKLCPKCNKYSCNIVTGYELLLERIEGERSEADINTKKYT